MWLGSLVAPCTRAAATPIQIDIPYTRYVLPNGLTLLVHEDHKAPIVTINVWYHVGSKNERFGRTGFAHLFEHLMFNGSEHYNDDYFKLLEPEGATTLNGTTDFDRTNYFQDVPVSALDLILWAEADRMGWLVKAIDQAKLDEQRGVVLNEKRQGENQPYGKVFRLLLEGLFPKGHPYSWEVIGLEEDLKAATLEDVHQWFKSNYGAANAVLCLAGDIDPATAKAKVEKYFGEIPAGPPMTRPQKWVPRRTGVQRAVTQDHVKLPMLLQAWTIPGWGTRESVALGLAGDILTTGKSSRLYKRLVYEDQLAVSVSAYPFALEIAGGFGIQVMLRPGIELARVERIVDEEVSRFLREGPKEDELQRVRSQRVAEFVRGVERIGGFGGKSDILLENQVYGNDPAYYKTTFNWLQTLGRDEIHATAREWLTDGKFVLEVAPFPDFTAQSTGLDRTQKPATSTPPEARFPAFQRTELENGLKVLTVESHAVPMVIFSLLIDAGYAADPADLPGLASMTAQMLEEGTAKRNSLKISDELQLLGAQLNSWADLDQCGLSLNTLKARLEPALELYQDVLLHPAFPEKELARLKQERLAGIQLEKSEPDAMVQRVLPRLLFGPGHPYASPLTGTGTEASTEKLTVADLRRYHGTWFKPNNATLVIVGDTTQSEILPVVKRVFGGWGRGEVPAKQIAAAALPGQPVVYVINKPGAEQSTIYAAQLAPPKADPQDFARANLNTLFGGKFTSRINMNLRENKHWTYGARSGFWDTSHQRPFVVNAPVQTDKTAESMAEIKRELQEIANDRPPTEKEVLETRRRAVLGLAGRWETMSAVAGSLSELVRFHYPDDYFQTYAARVAGIKPEEVGAVAKAMLRPEQLVWVVVGDREKIEDPIKKLGVGEVKVIEVE